MTPFSAFRGLPRSLLGVSSRIPVSLIFVIRLMTNVVATASRSLVSAPAVVLPISPLYEVGTNARLHRRPAARLRDAWATVENLSETRLMNENSTRSNRHGLSAIAVLLGSIALFVAQETNAATLTVDLDPVSGAGMVVIANDGLCSLREAIINANTATQTHPDCAAGDEASNDVVLPIGAVFTLTDAAVADGLGNTGLSYITSDLSIQGNGATIESGNACNRNNTHTAGEFRLLLVQQGALSTDNLTLANGCADGTGSARNGGAIYVDESLVIMRRTILRDNQARLGGAAYSINGSAIAIEASTLSGNMAMRGGALYVDGLTEVFNSTLSGNMTDSVGDTLYVQAGGSLSLEHTTVHGSGSIQTKAIYSDDASISIKNSLFSNVGCFENIEPSTWNAFGNNLDSGSGCANRFGANVTANVALNLGPLADNGGPTRTHALLPASPAIDTAASCTRLDSAVIVSDPFVVTDQRGEFRPQGAGCEVGAFEVDLGPRTIHVDTAGGVGVVPVLADGLCSLREALENANSIGVNHTDCEPGGSADTIVLPADAVFSISDGYLSAESGRTGLPTISTPVTIIGQGATIQRASTPTCNLNGILDPGELRLLLIENRGELTIEDVTLAGGCADGDPNTDAAAGGAIAVTGGQLIVRRSTLRDNQTNGTGGAILQVGTALLVDSSTLSGNAAAFGGALGVGAGLTTVRNSTLSGNSASSMGGAAFVTASTLNLEQSTLSDNLSPDGGGIKGFFFGVINARNLIMENSSCADVNELAPVAQWTLSGSGLDSGSSCVLLFLSPALVFDTSANLGPLAFNGGTTQTHALLPGSPAIDAANLCTAIDGSAVATDQRDVARPQGGVCDIGAFELHTPPTLGTIIEVDAIDGVGVVPVQSDSLCSLREAIENANATSASFAHGDCEPGRTFLEDVINLPSGAVFTLTDAAISAPFGNTGLPAISSVIVIRGNGATIQSGNACSYDGVQTPDEFRLFLVESGNLGFRQLTLANGCADGAGGSSARDGGAIYLQDGVMIASEVEMRDNRARRGGAIFSAGNLLFRDGTLSGNTATFGGALFTSGNARLSNATVSGNSVASLGGAAFIQSGATLNIEQSTLDNIFGQTGIYSSTSTVNLKNTILRNTRCSENIDLGPSVWNAFGNNLDDSNSCADRFGANITPSTDPRIGSLADHGGGTRTHALLPGSPAIDAAVSCTTLDLNAVVRDQRDIERPQGGLCDIGAFESRGFALATVSGSGQDATVGTVFAQPLVLEVSSAFGEPVDGGQVSFAAPESGASLATPTSLVSIAGGQASLAVAANNVVGPYAVTADARGSMAAANFILNNLGAMFEVTTGVAAGQGSITPTTQSVPEGGTAGFTINPDIGWLISSVTGDTCTPQFDSGDQWIAANITENCAVTASFNPDQIHADRFEVSDP